MLNEAALETVRRRGEQVSRADIYNGMDRILQVPAAPHLLTPAASRADHACPGLPKQEPSLRLHSLHSFFPIWPCNGCSDLGVPWQTCMHAEHILLSILCSIYRPAGSKILGSNLVMWQRGSGCQGVHDITEAHANTLITRNSSLSTAGLPAWRRAAGAVQGLRRPGMPKSFSISRSFAIHEAGKALVATVLRQDRERQGLKPRLERVERVSMVPRGRQAPPPPVMPAR